MHPVSALRSRRFSAISALQKADYRPAPPPCVAHRPTRKRTLPRPGRSTAMVPRGLTDRAVWLLFCGAEIAENRREGLFTDCGGKWIVRLNPRPLIVIAGTGRIGPKWRKEPPFFVPSMTWVSVDGYDNTLAGDDFLLSIMAMRVTAIHASAVGANIAAISSATTDRQDHVPPTFCPVGHQGQNTVVALL